MKVRDIIILVSRDEQAFANWAWLLANWPYCAYILIMVQNVQMKKRNKIGNKNKLNYIYKINNFN